MDIVLNTRFNNPNLPVVQRPGFRDDFNRPAADTLGTTLDGKPWTILDYGVSSSVWGTLGDGTAGMKSATSGRHAAVADALTPDGTLTAVVGERGTTGYLPGLTVRAADADNYIQIAAIGSTNQELRILKMVAGTSTSIPTIGPIIATGDTVEVTCAGTAITVAVNGATAITATIPELADVTTHGMYAFTGAVGTWDSVEFTPA